VVFDRLSFHRCLISIGVGYHVGWRGRSLLYSRRTSEISEPEQCRAEPDLREQGFPDMPVNRPQDCNSKTICEYLYLCLLYILAFVA
jgi:hypothetical protein